MTYTVRDATLALLRTAHAGMCSSRDTRDADSARALRRAMLVEQADAQLWLAHELLSLSDELVKASRCRIAASCADAREING